MSEETGQLNLKTAVGDHDGHDDDALHALENIRLHVLLTYLPSHGVKPSAARSYHEDGGDMISLRSVSSGLPRHPSKTVSWPERTHTESSLPGSTGEVEDVEAG
jgi:hypothetical protein